MGLFSKLGWKSRASANSIATILVTLHIDDEASLFILLAQDGTINRLGTGSVDNTDRDMFVGLSDSSAFKQVCRLAKPVLNNCLGEYTSRQCSGKQCKLAIVFETTGGEQRASAWQYGSQSQGPPPEVTNFVVGSIKATHLWWQAQKGAAMDQGENI